MTSTLQNAAEGPAGHRPARTLPLTAFSRRIDAVIGWIGEQSAWLWLVLVLIIVIQVLMRYLLGQGSIMFEELQWHIYGVAFLLGLSYCLQTDRHVRIDVFAEHWSLRTRAWIELLGLIFFLLPFVAAVILESFNLARHSWQLNEISPAPGGLPYRWVMKSFIVIGFILLILAALSRLSRCTALLFGFPRPLSPSQAQK